MERQTTTKAQSSAKSTEPNPWLHRPVRPHVTQQTAFTLQPKLAISQPGDVYEQEADRVADQVLRMPEPTVQRACAPCAAGGTPCPKCAAEKQEPLPLDGGGRVGVKRMQRQSESATTNRSAPGNFLGGLGAGRPLDSATRAFFEPRFRTDFSHVRVHTDDRAADSARSVNALAFTVGRDVVFGAGQYMPGTSAGKRLMAHELTHVVQQTYGRHTQNTLKNANEQTTLTQMMGPMIQRELATPEPATPNPTQPDLTEQQIRGAIRFNSQSYNTTNARLIQDILGGPVTGAWDASNIRAIAEIQQRFGLEKDGKVGPNTFNFIVNELNLEGAPTDTRHCLTMFRVVFHPVQSSATAGPGGTTQIRGHHVIKIRFSSRCNCSEFEYRQHIAGVATVSRGNVSQDLANFFSLIPGGSLPITFQEDGNTACPSQNYGHRNQAGEASTTASCGQNHYTDNAGTTDQPNGCVYEGEDFPFIDINSLLTGDVVDLLVEFRGQILRNGRVIQTKNWTDIDTTVTTP